MPIISDLQQLQATIFDKNFKRSRASIDRVFHEFLQCIYRRNNDLASSYFVDNILVESLERE